MAAENGDRNWDSVGEPRNPLALGRGGMREWPNIAAISEEVKARVPLR